MQLSPAAQDIVDFWTTTRTIPFKRKLIHRNKDGSCSMCAQGQVLHRNGYSEEELLNMSIFKADKETARILGISVAHSIFLRKINDSEAGSPQEVLSNPGKYLGPNWEKVLDFWLYLDTLSDEQLRIVGERYYALDMRERSIARDKATHNARITTIYADNAVDSVYHNNIAAMYATLELIGRVEKPVFVPMFHNLAITHRQE
jgi:hypothetical protein